MFIIGKVAFTIKTSYLGWVHIASRTLEGTPIQNWVENVHIIGRAGLGLNNAALGQASCFRLRIFAGLGTCIVQSGSGI
jgi:hypothetical protein